MILDLIIKALVNDIIRVQGFLFRNYSLINDTIGVYIYTISRGRTKTFNKGFKICRNK